MTSRREADRDQLRIPWLPACLHEHGLDIESVQDLSYIVVEEIVEDVVTLTISPWPAADGHGRLRFDVAHVDELALPIQDLQTQIYQGWLRRRPHIGDVFAAIVDGEVLRSAGTRGLWVEPLERIVPGPVYDLSAEARKVAKLALYASITELLTEADVKEFNMEAKADRHATAAKVRQTVGRLDGRRRP
jgi:hypothetical protein